MSGECFSYHQSFASASNFLSVSETYMLNMAWKHVISHIYYYPHLDTNLYDSPVVDRYLHLFHTTTIKNNIISRTTEICKERIWGNTYHDFLQRQPMDVRGWGRCQRSTERVYRSQEAWSSRTASLSEGISTMGIPSAYGRYWKTGWYNHKLSVDQYARIAISPWVTMGRAYH